MCWSTPSFGQKVGQFWGEIQILRDFDDTLSVFFYSPHPNLFGVAPGRRNVTKSDRARKKVIDLVLREL